MRALGTLVLAAIGQGVSAPDPALGTDIISLVTRSGPVARVVLLVLLLFSVAGILVGWGLKAPVEYEPVGPRAFPLLVFALLGVCAVALFFSRPAPTSWAPPPVLLRVGGLFPFNLTGDKLAAYIHQDVKRYAELAREFGLAAQ